MTPKDQNGSQVYMRTGDLGFTHEGELYVVGRLKELIIINGKNHYPQDIEIDVEHAHECIRAGCVASFSIEQGETEKLIVMAEIQSNISANEAAAYQSIAQAIRAAISEHHQLSVDQVILLKSSTIPKTSSGKIKRTICKKIIEKHELTDEILFQS